MKKALLIADTRIPLIGTLLIQIKDTNPNLFDSVIIYTEEEVDETNKKILQGIMSCRFIVYDHNFDDRILEKPRFQRFSKLSFCRYEIFRYLDEFDLVCWTDTDVVIKGDLNDLIQQACKTGFALVREDPINKSSINTDTIKTCFYDVNKLKTYDLEQYLYCSALFIVTKKTKLTIDFEQWCYKKTEEWVDILHLPDQGVINLAIQHFNIDVTPLSGELYGCYPYLNRDCTNAIIVHSWGSNKFWNDYYTNLRFPQWHIAYNKWVSMGGDELKMSSIPDISIIIPVFNPNFEEFRECLNSILDQNRNGWERYSNYEVIIISEPNEVIESFIKSFNDPRLRLIVNTSRLGISASLNKGILLAKGKYIARADSDDICSKNRFYSQYLFLEQHSNINMCITDYEYFGDMNEGRYCLEGAYSKAWSIFTCPFNHPTVMFRKNFIIDNSLFYDESRKYVEDWELWERCFDKGMKVGVIHEILYFHRWINSASAGQTSETARLMCEMTYNNFLRLGIDIRKEDLKYVSPYQGVVPNDVYGRLQKYFSDALESNRILKLYDTKALSYVFNLRLHEARYGSLPDVVIPKAEVNKTEVKSRFVQKRDKVYRKMKDILCPFLWPIIKPVVKPLRHKRSRIINIQETSWKNEGILYDCISKLDTLLKQNEQLSKEIAEIKRELKNK